MNLIKLLVVFSVTLLAACTTGQLSYVDAKGNQKLACEVEFVGLPSVDKYAVEYALSLCAKNIVKNGHSISETHLLEIDTSIPDPPCGEIWTHAFAKQEYKKAALSKKQYGYLVAHIDLRLAVINQCR
ncbi:hypothetical protein [Aliiglaciecola lipolytica]|uniref:hypothetical protein n=1 Tax=Aliiglaciecola lipolytica TaxID=477689 RepID=UPI001C09BAEF|nr:hypothetical protein [Aliiglaciecola lipolytica]MBU2877398.1 hypothetical protein [Aliiglaciecola lipolytica]